MDVALAQRKTRPDCRNATLGEGGVDRQRAADAHEDRPCAERALERVQPELDRGKVGGEYSGRGRVLALDLEANGVPIIGTSPDMIDAAEDRERFQKLLQDVTSDLQIKNPQVNVEIDRDKASALGINANQVEDALYTAYGQRQIRSSEC